MRSLDEQVLIALDGTEFRCLDKIHCANCSNRKRAKSGIEYFQTILAAKIVAPGHNRAASLEPEFIVPQGIPGHLAREMGTTSRTAKGAPLGVGWPCVAPGLPSFGWYIWAITCSPDSRSVKPFWPPPATSCSSARQSRTRRSRNSEPGSSLMS
jgi:hypothetical protein